MVSQPFLMKNYLLIIFKTNSTRNTDYLRKTPYFKPKIKILKLTNKQQKFFKIFNFQRSQINLQQIHQLAELLLKHPLVYATSKFDVGKLYSPLHLRLKPDRVFKKLRASEVPNHLQDKIKRLVDFLEQYEIISPVNKEEKSNGNLFVNPVIILAKGELLKTVLDSSYLNSRIDESKGNWL